MSDSSARSGLNPAKEDVDIGAMAGIEEVLSALVRFPTVSQFDPGKEEEAPFENLRACLRELFPAVHKTMLREDVGARGLLFEWKGRNPSLEPTILCAHFDVVPAEDAPLWEHDPFSGDIAGGAVWGRGTQDIKVMLASALFAAEKLIGAGFTPERTVFFAFGGDEETGGTRGAARVAARLAEKGIRASFLLDEGGPIADGMLSFADKPLALVGIAEKGYMDVQLTATASGGHASMPPKRTATGDLCRAVAAIEAHPFPPRLVFTVRSFLSMLSPHVPAAYRALFRNLWLTAPLVKMAFSGAATTNALIRTTAAPTMLRGSGKENVLADKASAIVNMRILPGETTRGALDRVQGIVARYGVQASNAYPDNVVEPSDESPVDHEGWRALVAALSASFPHVAAVPFLFSAGTDTKHYRYIARAIYRFTPLSQTQEDLKGVHGRNEKVEIGNLRRAALFYRALLRNL